MTTLPKLINDFCFQMDLNETIWPLDNSINNSIPTLSSSILWSFATNFKNLAKIERENVDRNTSCNLRIGLFPNEHFIIHSENYICSSSYEIFIMLLHYYRCRLVYFLILENFHFNK